MSTDKDICEGISTTLEATQATRGNSAAPDTNYGLITAMKIGYSTGSGGTFGNAWIEFDVSQFEENVQNNEVVEAELLLTVMTEWGTTAQEELTLARCTKAFVETEATWNDYADGESWDTPGGDHSTTETVYTSMTVGDESGDQRVDIKELVVDAIENRDGILRIMIFMPESPGYAAIANYGDDEHATKFPTLTVTTVAQKTAVGLRSNNAFTLDIIGGDDLTTTNCILRENKTTLLGRGSRAYVQEVRDNMVTYRNLSPPPHYQDEWAFNKNNLWTPAELEGLETWFSPESFYHDVDDDQVCTKLQNRSTIADAGAGATGGITTSFTETYRGLNGLAFTYNPAIPELDPYYKVRDETDWNVGTSDFFGCILLSGADTDSDALEYILNKEDGFYLRHDWTSTKKDVAFGYGSGFTSGQLTEAGGAQAGDYLIYSFGRKGGYMFLRGLTESREDEMVSDRDYTRDLDVLSEPWIGKKDSSTNGGFNKDFVELIFVNDAIGGGEVSDLTNVKKTEGYLAHKYNLTLPSTHEYYEEGPKVDE